MIFGVHLFLRCDMPEQYQESMTGTTTVGLIFTGGVILATEKRATMGYMIASKRAKKVYQIANLIGMTIAGGVGDAQQACPDHHRRVQPVPDTKITGNHRRGRFNPALQLPEPEPLFPVLRPVCSLEVSMNMGPGSIRSMPWVGQQKKRTSSLPVPVRLWLMVCWKTGTAPA